MPATFNRDALSLGVLSLDMDRLDTFAPERNRRRLYWRMHAEVRLRQTANQWLLLQITINRASSGG
jgi:hypothetical protein